MPDKNKNLYYLDELPDYKIEDNYCDVRGWEVQDADSRTIGKVDNLLVNKEAERVVYLDVEMDKSVAEDEHETSTVAVGNCMYEFLNKDGDNHIIIPAELVRLEEKTRKVICEELTHETFVKTRRFIKGTSIGSCMN